MMNIQDKENFWLRLDNAAKIYPAIKNKELTSVFRIGVELKERIRVRQFREAVDSIERRFPYYKIVLKTGFFWYYLEHRDFPVVVQHDTGIPCRAFRNDELMFRILAKENRISVEFSHILTDGTGALEFLKTLLMVYFTRCGLSLPDKLPFLRPGDAVSEEEFEDAYGKYFEKIETGQAKMPDAFHVPFPLKKSPRFSVLTAVVPAAPLIQKAKEHQVSLTEYLTAVYLYALQKIYTCQSASRKRKSNKTIRIEVPVNLRKVFPSKTMRNFSLYVMPGIDLSLGYYTFEEIVKVVYHQMQLETDKKLISKMISRNVGGERNPLIRGIPLFVKSFVLSRLYNKGTKAYSGVVTNLGNVKPGADTLINQFVFIPPPPNKILKVNCGIAGFNGKLVLSFGNITQSMELERHFLTFLTSENIPVKIVKH